MSTIISNWKLPTKEESQARTGHGLNLKRLFNKNVFKFENLKRDSILSQFFGSSFQILGAAK